MPVKAKHLDLSVLSPSARREMRDFYQFLLSRQVKQRKQSPVPATNRGFVGLCGRLSWKGDAVAAQRSMRDEW